MKPETLKWSKIHLFCALANLGAIMYCFLANQPQLLVLMSFLTFIPVAYTRGQVDARKDLEERPQK